MYGNLDKMDKLPVKVRELSPIVISLIEKIQTLESTSNSKKFKIDCTKELLEVVDEFRHFFVKALITISNEELKKIFEERIERAFSQFDWSVNVAASPFEFYKFSENGRRLISAVLKLLGTRGCGILIVETYLKFCFKIVNDMINNEISQHTVDKSNCKSLLEGVLSAVKILRKYWHIALLPNHRSLIILYLSQICKGLPGLIKMIEVKNRDIKMFTLRKLQQCFSKILDAIHYDENVQSKDSGQEFIILMDYCLNKLNQLANDNMDFPNFMEKANQNTKILQPMIDELICYAMSLSQVTQFENDYNALMSSSRKVLREINDLHNCLNLEDIYQIKLNAQSLGEALCSMEQQINATVLHLVLEVFSGINCPLKNIVNKCRTDMYKDNKASEDLKLLISEFDSEMDKIMQIGLFAIACTSDLNRIVKIQSCLASLESLEAEVIPSLTALYMDCNGKTKSNFQHLIDFWLNEMTELKVLIDSILDPAGFCKVVEKEIKTLIEELKNLSSSDLSPSKYILIKITRYSRKLVKTLKISLEDNGNISDETEQHLKNFQLAVQECEEISKLLEKEVNKYFVLAIKKSEILYSKLSKLCNHLFELIIQEGEGQSTEISVKVPSTIPQNDYYKICSSFNETITNSNDVDILTPYIEKGILRSKKRNIMYSSQTKAEKELTEKFEETLLSARHWDKTPKSIKRSRCCKLLNLNLELGNTVDLEITSVLENLTEISNAFEKKEPNSKKFTSREEKNIEKRDEMCGTDNYESGKLKSSGCCANICSQDSKYQNTNKEMSITIDEGNRLGSRLRNEFLQSLNDLSKSSSLALLKEDVNSQLDTPDRLNDLKMVDEKINFLKGQVPCLLP